MNTFVPNGNQSPFPNTKEKQKKKVEGENSLTYAPLNPFPGWVRADDEFRVDL